MRMKPGGWHRLWIVSGVLWLSVVLVFAVGWFPSIEDIDHSDSFYQEMNADAREALNTYQTLQESEQELQVSRNQRFGDWRDHFTSLEEIDAMNAQPRKEVTFPNAHVLEFLPPGYWLQEVETPFDDDFLTRIDIISAGYNDVLRQKLSSERKTFVTYALGWWLIPCLLVYLLGWAVGWVRRGFKQSDPVHKDPVW